MTYEETEGNNNDKDEDRETVFDKFAKMIPTGLFSGRVEALSNQQKK